MCSILFWQHRRLFSRSIVGVYISGASGIHTGMLFYLKERIVHLQQPVLYRYQPIIYLEQLIA